MQNRRGLNPSIDLLGADALGEIAIDPVGQLSPGP
jgi:hypothetical protein